MKKILVILFLSTHSILSSFSSFDAKLHDTTPEEKSALPEQNDPFSTALENYRKHSWFEQSIRLSDGDSYRLEIALLKAFYNPNGSFNDFGNRQILDIIKSHPLYSSQLAALPLHSSLENWVEFLNLAEIARFNQFLQDHPEFLNLNQPQKDDLVKAIMLSGIIWRVKKEIFFMQERFKTERLFSAMLIPGQAHDKNSHYRIYTCFHGFKEKCSDAFEYYFVPYGMNASEDPTKNNFVGKIAFKIEFIQHFMSPFKLMQDITFNRTNHLLSISGDLNEDNDLIIAFIQASSENGQTLKNFFNSYHETFIQNRQISDSQLPMLNEENESLYPHSFNEMTDSLFVIGKAPDKTNSFPNDRTETTSLLTSLTPGTLWEASRRKEESILPSPVVQDFGTGLPTILGMSGSGILQCRWKNNKRICKIIGTLYGNKKNYSSTMQTIITHINTIP